jgi:hypothetical protein
VIRLGRPNFTIQLSDILPSSAFLKFGEHIRGMGEARLKVKSCNRTSRYYRVSNTGRYSQREPQLSRVAPRSSFQEMTAMR